MNRVFIDMDGVIVDFEKKATELSATGDQVKIIPGAYASMKPLIGALAGVVSIIGMGYDVFIATKPPTGVAHAYSEKAQWILDYLPQLKRKIIITSDKGLLGDSEDIIIDDRPHKANIENFKGTVIRFGHNGIGWEEVLTILRVRRNLMRMLDGQK